VKTIFADIVIFGADKVTHDRNLESYREMEIKSNHDITEVSKLEVPFFGHLFTSQGLKMDSA
jgi:hypothetical protein